jgi:hypothetical protein
MGELSDDVALWHTPAVGAYLLWRFTSGYCAGHANGDAPVGLLHFIAAAILSSKELAKTISDKRDSLQSYVRGFEDLGKSDLLLSIQERARAKRSYTLAAIDIAIAEGLLVWDMETGKLLPRAIKTRAARGKALKESFNRDGRKAEILGRWFAQHDPAAIATYLRVLF